MKRNFKSVILCFSFTILICSEALAVIQTGTDCDGKCDWVYDSESEGGPSLVFTAKEGATGELAIKNNYYRFYGVNGGYNLNLQPNNIIIGEGITAVTANGTTVFENVGLSGGKLVIPSTLKKLDTNTTGGGRAAGFSTIEINSTNLEVMNGALILSGDRTNINIVMSPSDNISFDSKAIKCSYKDCKGTINIQCKGAKATCDESLAGVKSTIEANGGTYNSDYYREIDTNKNVTLQYFDDGYRLLNDQGFYDVYDLTGNLIGYSNLNGREVYDQSGALLAKYDENGKMLDGQQHLADGSFAVFKNGNLVGFKGKRIYTVDEATAVTGRKNTFKLKYR